MHYFFKGLCRLRVLLVIACTLSVTFTVLHLDATLQRHVLASFHYVSGKLPATCYALERNGVFNGGEAGMKIGVGGVKTIKREILSYSGSCKYCPKVPPNLVGPLKIDLDTTSLRTFDPDLEPGGAWRPRDCIARHRVAIIIPYRDRLIHLSVLLHHLIPVLKRQQLDFQIFVVEQKGNLTFNKGRIMNAGFIEALKEADFECFIFHDVDLIPEDDRNMYSCSQQPRHMSIAVDKFKYQLPYLLLVGGVFSIRTEQFQRLNGFSNLYWGWGAEDDDMGMRIKAVGLNITRPPVTVGRYRMFKHDSRERSPLKWRMILLKTVSKRYRKDGLNSLVYNITKISYKNFYTHIMVDVGPPPEIQPNLTAFME